MLFCLPPSAVSFKTGVGFNLFLMHRAPAAMLLTPSAKIEDRVCQERRGARAVPDGFPVRSVASRSIPAPSSISLAIVTRPLQTRGRPHFLAIRTLLAREPCVTRTESVSTLVPRRIHSRALSRKSPCTLGGEPLSATAGTWVHMAAGLPNSIVAKTPFVMLLMLFK